MQSDPGPPRSGLEPEGSSQASRAGVYVLELQNGLFMLVTQITFPSEYANMKGGPIHGSPCAAQLKATTYLTPQAEEALSIGSEKKCCIEC